ncbi:sensor histidine kinase [Thermodesulfobacteriota bacterium]
MTKDGRTIFVDIRISPSEYMGHDALLITTSDITNRLMAEQQLIQAGKMATLGEMATGIAHELNQPLTVIKTASSFLIKKVSNDQKIKEDILKTMAEEIDSHVDRASKIISHLREFGRKSEVRKRQVNVNEALVKALDMFSQQLKLRNIEVVKDLDPKLPTVLADANRLEQVFVNLLINARDAIEEKWEQEASGKEPKRIYLKTGVQDEKVTVAVMDNGSGIPDHARDRIFEPFFTTKTVGKGTGLGLSISYGIIQDYDGTIKVISNENEGSEFVVQFPLLNEA